MKKILTILISTVLTVMNIYGQNTDIALESGIKSDVTFLNFQKSGAPDAVSTLTPGFTIGGFMNLWFKEWIGIRPELNLNKIPLKWKNQGS